MLNTDVKINGFVARATSPSALKMLAATLGARKTIFSKNMIWP